VSRVARRRDYQIQVAGDPDAGQRRIGSMKTFCCGWPGAM
jgi:hypothetical protein